MGERNFTKWGFQDIIAKRLVSYLNPDIVHCGGISEFKKIAAMAEAQYIEVSPHITYSKVGLTAEIHMGLNCPNSVIQEMGSYANEPFKESTDWMDDLFFGHRYQIEDGFRAVAGHPRSRTRAERGGGPSPPLRTATPRGAQVRGRVGGGQLNGGQEGSELRNVSTHWRDIVLSKELQKERRAKVVDRLVELTPPLLR